MGVRIVYTRKAQIDLVEIEDYIALDSPRLAKRWIQRLLDRALQLKTHPLSGNITPEFEQEDIRQLVIGSYRIIYQIAPSNTIYILRVLHSARLLE